MSLTPYQLYYRKRKQYIIWTYNRILNRKFTRKEFVETFKEVERQHGVLKSPGRAAYDAKRGHCIYDFRDRLDRAIRSLKCSEIKRVGKATVFIKPLDKQVI